LFFVQAARDRAIQSSALEFVNPDHGHSTSVPAVEAENCAQLNKEQRTLNGGRIFATLYDGSARQAYIHPDEPFDFAAAFYVT
jgi:hypothetical protein